MSDVESETHAFMKMMRVDKTSLEGRVFFYDPREDTKNEAQYARRHDHRILVPMLWSQTLLYFMFQRMKFKLTVKNTNLQSTVIPNNCFD